MCLAVPMKIIKINGDRAVCDLSGVKKEISVALSPGAKIGDYVMVHAGFAIQKMNSKDAIETLAAWQELSHSANTFQGDLSEP